MPAQKTVSVIALVLTYLNNAIELDDDVTDDPAMEADSLAHGCAATCRGLIIMTIDASFPPMGIVLVRMSPRNIFYLSLTDSVTRTEPKGTRNSRP